MNPKLEQIFVRRSTRKYQDKAVPTELIQDLLEAGMAAPSACCKDPWRFIVLTQKELLKRLAGGLPNGKMLEHAPLGIVVCGELKAAHDNQVSYLLQDCAAAIQNVLLAASMLGLGGVWLGVHPREDRIKHVSQTLGMPDGVVPVAVLAIGWPAEKHEPRTRYAVSNVHHDKW